MNPAAPDRPTVVLASASPTRARLLSDAGLAIRTIPADIDEAAIKNAMRAEDASALDTATALAETKAMRVSMKCPGDLVIGADQMLECDGRWYDKPHGLADVRAHLHALRGRQHTLVTSVVVVQDGARLWQHSDTADLVMRPFSDAFLDQYITAAGEDALTSVGGYRLEGLGAQLFESVRGDYFTVLGLPLLPLLEFFRSRGAVTP